MSEKQRRWGQFYSTSKVVDLVLGFCLRRPTDSLLDPSCGEGAFLLRAARYQRWLSSSGARAGRDTLWGIEIDRDAAALAETALTEGGHHAHLLSRDFFSLRPGQQAAELDGQVTRLPQAFDCVVGNPPYTRSEWLDGVSEDPGYRDRLIEHVSAASEDDIALNKRAGLHAYFLLHGTNFLRPGGRLGFIVSNSWLDVDYGRGLKQFLLDRFRILAIIESGVERWFDDARINTCLVILERCDEPAGRDRNQVRLARLWRPLAELIPGPENSPRRAVEVENLVMRLMPGDSRLSPDLSVRVLRQRELDPAAKWGPLLRAPDVFFVGRSAPQTASLGDLAAIHRGQTTGANAFFYLHRDQAQRWQIEDRFLRPLLKSPKEIDRLVIRPDDLATRVLMIDPELDALNQARGAYDYVQSGEQAGVHRRPTCARRSPWYVLPPSKAVDAHLAWPKGVWNRHFALLVAGDIVADQQFYVLTIPAELIHVLAALLNSTWVALQAELLGRSNFGQGVLWLAGYEVSQIRVPDPRTLSPSSARQLGAAFPPIADEPLLPLRQAVQRPARQTLDQLVFDLLGLGPSQRQEVIESAVRLVEGRATRAGAG